MTPDDEIMAELGRLIQASEQLSVDIGLLLKRLARMQHEQVIRVDQFLHDQRQSTPEA